MASTYELLDFGHLRRLEQWGPVRVVRPDPRAIGATTLPQTEWDGAAARFEGRVGRGAWERSNEIPDRWEVSHAGLRFEIRLTPSMHLGLFPEQAQHWEWIRRVLGSVGPVEVLNLFAYTGGASVALAALGHKVTHVDAARPSVAWARRNAALNELTTIRWIEDDAREFVRRERRRKRSYDALILDPPTFGRSGGRVWRLDRDLEPLLQDALLLLPAPRFVLLNTYDLDASDAAVRGLLEDQLASAGYKGLSVESGSLDLHTPDGRALPTGSYARMAR